MTKKLTRLIHPGMGVYFSIMLCFCLAALLMNQLMLAAVEGLVTALLFISYMILRRTRHQDLLRYIQSIPETVESVSRGKSPFPTVIARLSDGCIIWANDAFVSITDFSDAMVEQSIDDVLPGFATDWLAEHKTESPYDVTIRGHRYRVYGSRIRAEDTMGTPLGVFYFSDLTMLYQVRDEYVRSRPEK